MSDRPSSLEEQVSQFDAAVRADCQVVWDLIPLDLYDPVEYEVIAALVARQGSLVLGLAWNPHAWNPHVDPLFQRAMSDVLITLSYLLHKDARARCKDFVLYGLGQEKLAIHHLEQLLESTGESERKDIAKHIEVRTNWLNAQRRDYLTEVNLGSFSGKSTFEMAQECGELGLYNFNWVPFSGGVHSHWHHIGRFNATVCGETLHANHFMPQMPYIPPESHSILIATKTFARTLNKVAVHYTGNETTATAWDYITEEVPNPHDSESNNG